MKLLLSLQLRGHTPLLSINTLCFFGTISYTIYHIILEVPSTSSDSRMKNQGPGSTTCPWCSLLKQGSEEHDIALSSYLASSYLIRKPADRYSTSKRKHHSLPFSSLFTAVLKVCSSFAGDLQHVILALYFSSSLQGFISILFMAIYLTRSIC